MSKTAIVQDDYAADAVHDAVSRALDEASIRQDVLRGMCIEVALEKFSDVITARPPVPDELIEEAAKAIFLAPMNDVRHRAWEELDEEVREHFRNMARAAARVFNGGKDE